MDRIISMDHLGQGVSLNLVLGNITLHWMILERFLSIVAAVVAHHWRHLISLDHLEDPWQILRFPADR